jgi:hypothetical protein
MISNIHRNIMGTISFDAKFNGMRKAQDFIVYPMKENATEAVIQSDTRIGRDRSGKRRRSAVETAQRGCWVCAADAGVCARWQLSQDDLNNLKASIRDTAGARVGTHGVVSDNSAAATVFGKVPE